MKTKLPGIQSPNGRIKRYPVVRHKSQGLLIPSLSLLGSYSNLNELPSPVSLPPNQTLPHSDPADDQSRKTMSKQCTCGPVPAGLD
ncbi:hypothetical protein MRB53_024874 [Persea americana]|uniref:Uncharacterized protein n=1 Tax=Persea americana TaxID=3435 RepID=A0ACC2LEC8_PERAE|nr:hypothetical protein MRB53_024874 [Persea americana]